MSPASHTSQREGAGSSVAAGPQARGADPEPRVIGQAGKRPQMMAALTTPKNLQETKETVPRPATTGRESAMAQATVDGGHLPASTPASLENGASGPGTDTMSAAPTASEGAEASVAIDGRPVVDAKPAASTGGNAASARSSSGAVFAGSAGLMVGCGLLAAVGLLAVVLAQASKQREAELAHQQQVAAEQARQREAEAERERRRALEAKGIWNDASSGPRRVDGELVWVEVPAGRGQIGDDIEGSGDEKPSFLVEFTAPFELLISEVSNRQYASIVRGHQPIDDEPVVNVTWDQAKSWCEAAGGRLPTELEWEYAARAGGGGPYGRGQGGEVVTEANLYRYAWFDPTADAQPVRQKVPNAWGLYDLWGNVWEWTLDGYEDTAYQQLQAGGKRDDTSDKIVITDPGFVDTIDNAPPGRRVDRGGSAWNGPGLLRSGNRNGHSPSNSNEVLGFRCVRAPARHPLNLAN
jgi:formylglycine-generating enzyme required for sulfatase activity